MRLRTFVALCVLALAAACNPPVATEPPFTGVWSGPLPVSATEQRTFVMVIHERADRSLMGYLLGGTSRRLIQGAIRSGDRMLVGFDMENDGGIGGDIVLSGDVSGDTLTGETMLGGAEYAVTWTRRTDPLTVRNFVFAASADGGGEPSELTIVQDSGGAIIAGNFSSGDCDFIACAGAVTTLAETPVGDLTITIATDGTCAGTATITAPFIASGPVFPGGPVAPHYAGTWSRTAAGCPAASGSLIGGRDVGTYSTHVVSVLGNLGQLADDIEAGVTFGTTHAALAPTYLHFGEDAAAFLAARNTEIADHPSADIQFHSFTSIRTVVPAGHLSLLSNTLGVTFADERRSGGSVYREVQPGMPAQSGLYFLVENAGSWRLNGNHVGPFDFPFQYTIGAERLIVPTSVPGGQLYVSLGGWGTHFGPQTGHLEGNAKIDMMAQYVGSISDVTELANGVGGAAGVCDLHLVRTSAGEVCGIAATAEQIRNRIFTYRSPYPGTVTEITYQERPRPASEPQTHYFDNVPHWGVTVDYPGGLSIRYGHLGQITGAVRAGLMSATGINPDMYSPPLSPACPATGRCDVNVLDGHSFTINAGDEIARAQTDAVEMLPAHPGYWQAQIGPSITPWSQVEFFMGETLGFRGADVCAYQYLPAATRTAMATTMTADMLNPQSLRYAPNSYARPWKYRAEAELCNNSGYLRRDENDFSAINAQLGGWFERPSSGVTADEQFGIAHIHHDAAAYDASLYDVLIGGSQPTEYLVGRRRLNGMAYSWTAPSLAAPVVSFYPAGEVLELTDASFVVKWRELGATADVTLYQRAAYELDGDGLRIHWGALATTLAAATAPTLTPGAACDGADIVCYNHTRPAAP